MYYYILKIVLLFRQVYQLFLIIIFKFNINFMNKLK